MKTLLTIVSLFIILPMLSQEKATYKILVHERPSAREERKEFELWRGENENLLVIKKKKKGRLSLSKEDSLRIVSLQNEEDKKSRRELISLIEKRIEYETDTISIQEEQELFEITDSLFKNRKHIKKDLYENKDRRIILDGTSYTITLLDFKNHSQIYRAYSPTEESHPEIYKLISALHKADTTKTN